MLQSIPKLMLCAAAVVLATFVLPAAAPQDVPSSVHGIAIPAIPGAPFSAIAVIESEQDWPDGWTEVYRTINIIARDSKGRTHNESRELMPESFHGSPALTSVEIFDPATHIRIVYEPATHTARRVLLPQAPTNPETTNPEARVESLGTSTLNGLPAKGIRRTLTLSKKESRFGRPIDIVDEVWHSDDLHLDLLLRHDDPRLGVNTIGISSLKREEPPASLFDVPSGYQILNVAPPGGSPSLLPRNGDGSAAPTP